MIIPFEMNGEQPDRDGNPLYRRPQCPYRQARPVPVNGLWGVVPSKDRIPFQLFSLFAVHGESLPSRPERDSTVVRPALPHRFLGSEQGIFQGGAVVRGHLGGKDMPPLSQRRVQGYGHA